MMRNKLFLIPVGLFLLLFLVIHSQSSRAETSEAQRPAHPNRFYDEVTFLNGVSRAEKDNTLSNYHISGGIIPHHLFPGFILADFFYHLSKQKPKTIILIGPNHYEKGKHKMLTSTYGWETPYGVVNPNDKVIRELISHDIVKVEEKVLPNDHSVAGIMPFIKYYLPDTEVVPILLSGFTTQKESEALAEYLKNYVDKDTVLVAPVDFSHYLANKEAQEKDKRTLEVMRSYDYRQLFTLNNDYLDSPASIAVLLMVMQKLGTTNMDILQHTNSGELQNDDFIETTSYFSIAYY